MRLHPILLVLQFVVLPSRDGTMNFCFPGYRAPGRMLVIVVKENGSQSARMTNKAHRQPVNSVDSNSESQTPA